MGWEVVGPLWAIVVALVVLIFKAAQLVYEVQELRGDLGGTTAKVDEHERRIVALERPRIFQPGK